MEAVMNSLPVKLSASAIAEVKRLLEKDGAVRPLRVGVKGGGCSGMTYVLGFDIPKADDMLFNFEGIPCCMEPPHQLYLYGIVCRFFK